MERSMTLLVLGLHIFDAAALQLCCPSRLGSSRIAQPAMSRVARICLCDASVEEAPAEEAPAEAAVEAPAAKNSKTPLEELQVGAELTGKIRSVMSYGAFVDVGASTDGLLHVSEISNEFIKDATEKLTAGESVTCKVKAVNLEKGQLALTCKEPREPRARAERKPKADLTEFENADEKEFITGKVNTITDFGAFVTIKEGVDGLVHISQIQDGGVNKVGDVLTVGQEVQVRVTSVDKAKRRIGLSMRAWVERSESDDRGRRGGGGGPDIGFGEADAAFKLTDDELESLNVGDEFASPFEVALERAAVVAAKKASRERYSQPVL